MIALRKIISGGQTGVDQGALRAAQSLGFSCGGWCPPGRACESGIIPLHFPLQEMPEERSPNAPGIPRSLRTEWNVRDSDATLILQPHARERPDPGTAWTMQCATEFGRPLLVCDPCDVAASGRILGWLTKCDVRTLNVAGPCEGTSPGIGEQTFTLLHGLLLQSRASSA